MIKSLRRGLIFVHTVWSFWTGKRLSSFYHDGLEHLQVALWIQWRKTVCHFKKKHSFRFTSSLGVCTVSLLFVRVTCFHHTLAHYLHYNILRAKGLKWEGLTSDRTNIRLGACSYWNVEMFTMYMFTSLLANNWKCGPANAKKQIT